MKHRTGIGITVALMLLAAFIVVESACPAGTVHDFNQANKGISDGLSQLEAQNESLYSQKVIDASDALQISTFVLEVKADHLILTQQLRAYTPATGSAQVISQVQTFVNSVQEINLHLKSSQAQQAFQAFIALFNAAIATIQAALPPPTAVVSPDPPQTPIQRSDLSGGAEIEITLAAFTALAKLIASWRASGSLTDAQLQSAADAEDNATGQSALTFIQSLPKS